MPPPPFQALTIKFEGRADKVITPLTVFPAFDPSLSPIQAPEHRTRALWDTGASKSVISPTIVSALSLAPTGATNVLHAGGVSISKTYVVSFALPNRVLFMGCLVSEFPGSLGAGGFEAIIGMDSIGLGDFAITNFGGKTCMSFRVPSSGLIDYVTEHNRMSFAGVGRNDPCPCGAKPDGRPKKFKQCHLGAV